MSHYFYYDLSKIFIGSQNAGLLVTPSISKNRLGSRAFSYWAPLLWNQLSPHCKKLKVGQTQNCNAIYCNQFLSFEPIENVIFFFRQT